MSEEVSQHQTLHLIILGLKRYHGLESFYRLRQIPPSLDSAMEHPTVHWPYVVIHYRLGIELYPSYEICRWEMSPTEAGFSVNRGEYLIEVNISSPAVILTASQDRFTGLVTLLLPSVRPETFSHTVRLYTSMDRSRNVAYFQKLFSVPGPRLEEFLEGSGIEQPIRKLRPKGLWSSPMGMSMVGHFQRLADNGDHVRFTRHKKLLQMYIDRNPRFVDLLPLILYEETLLDLHENRHEDAKKHANQALETSQRFHSPNHCYILSKLKYVESALARRKGDYERARECLDVSVELLWPCAAGEETAENRYFCAAYFAEKSARIGITAQEETLAEQYFQDVQNHLIADTRPITNRCQIRSKNRQLAFYVKSSRHVKHLDVQRVVPEPQMAKAQQLIREIETHHLVYYQSKPRMSFDIVKTDYFIRRGNYAQGIEPSAEAFQIAEEKAWHEYKDVARERLHLCIGRMT